ncbi:MAG: hypothetical protein JSR44_13630 [Spirochaetes bacterium]|nr:hypothetical protein [Spirochaetota bacterium]
MRSFLLVTPLIYSFCLSCTDNKLHTYLLAEGVRAKGAENKQGEISLNRAPRKLTLVVPDPEELETLADDLKLTSQSKYHRLPPLTYLRFEFENTTAIPWYIDFESAYFSEPTGKEFRPVKSDDYAARFTSAAYEHFKFAAMYAGYITRHDKDFPKDRFWFHKFAPHERIELRRGEAGFRIVPFDFIPAGVENLVFHYNIDGKSASQSRHHSARDKFHTEHGLSRDDGFETRTEYVRELKIRLATERGDR